MYPRTFRGPADSWRKLSSETKSCGPKPRGTRWKDNCMRHDDLRKIGQLQGVGAFKLSDLVYETITDSEKHHFDWIGEFHGELNEDNYCEVIQALVNMDEADNAIRMRRFDLFDHQLDIEYKVLEDSSFERNDNGLKTISACSLHVEGLSKGWPAVKPDDFIIMRDSSKTCKVTSITRLEGDTIEMSIKKFEENRKFLGSLLDIFFVTSGLIYDYFEMALDRFQADQSIRQRIFGSESWIGLADPKIRVEPGQFPSADKRLEALNELQQQAVLGILANECYPKPYMMICPPATGKTHTLVEAIAQIYLREPSARILYCAYFKICANKALEKLRQIDLLDPVDIILFRDSTKPGDIGPSRIVVSTTVDSFKLMDSCKFDYVLIDEAGHAHEAETLLPICSLTREGCLVMAGDHMQPRPVVLCREAARFGLGISMFERLLRLPEYRLVRFTDQYNFKYRTKLLVNYRSDERIVALPNQLLYWNQLKCVNRTPNSLMRILNLETPIQFFNVKGGVELQESNSPSWVNDREGYLCVDLVMKLYMMGIDPNQIAMITPYKYQVHSIKKKLEIKLDEQDYRSKLSRRFGERPDGWHCKVDTIDAFQGDEREIIIISTVRTSREKYQFLDDNRRVNVALARARWLVFVLGHRDLLASEENWSRFLSYAGNDVAWWPEDWMHNDYRSQNAPMFIKKSF